MEETNVARGIGRRQERIANDSAGVGYPRPGVLSQQFYRHVVEGVFSNICEIRRFCLDELFLITVTHVTDRPEWCGDVILDHSEHSAMEPRNQKPV